MLPTSDLDDFLLEFDQVVQNFDKGEALQYEQHLEELKRRTLPSLYDSGIDDSESECDQSRFGGWAAGKRWAVSFLLLTTLWALWGCPWLA